MRALPPFANRPDDERLAAPHIARGEHVRHIGCVGGRSALCMTFVGVCLCIATSIALDAKSLQHRRHRMHKAHRQQHQVGLHFPCAARDFLHLAVFPFDPRGFEPGDLPVFADQGLRGDRPIARNALFMRRRSA